MQIDKFRELLPRPNQLMKVVPVIDWLSISLTNPTETIPEALTDGQVYQASEKITLRYFGKGTEHYRFIWHVLYQGEHLATLLSHTRNEKFVKRGVCKLDIKNHLLYTGKLWPFYHELTEALHLQYKNVSRVDIAIDGLNHILKFVNLYVKQTGSGKVVELKGRGRFKSNLLDRPTMLYNSFQLGAPGGRKQLTIYNKSQEIVKSQKDYIQKFWLANGIARQLMPLELLAKLMAKKAERERYHIDGYENIYRLELRLKGEAVLEMKDFSLDWLKTADGLMSIMRRQLEKFFEFVELVRGDVSKCPVMELIPFHQFSIQPIELQRIIRRDDLYKTKLSIKKNVHQLYLGVLGVHDYSAAEMLVFDVNNYELKDWFNKRLPEWNKEFSAALGSTDADHLQTVQQFLMDLNERFIANTESEILI